jgi:hypothetical protein
MTKFHLVRTRIPRCLNFTRSGSYSWESCRDCIPSNNFPHPGGLPAATACEFQLSSFARNDGIRRKHSPFVKLIVGRVRFYTWFAAANWEQLMYELFSRIFRISYECHSFLEIFTFWLHLPLFVKFENVPVSFLPRQISDFSNSMTRRFMTHDRLLFLQWFTYYLLATASDTAFFLALRKPTSGIWFVFHVWAS